MPIRSPVSGFLVKQAYQEGAMVQPGDLLFEIDTKAAQSGYTKIVSPIAGVAGRSAPGLGDLINPGMTLTTVSSLDPIKAEYALSSDFYRNHADWVAKILALPLSDRPQNIQLLLADGTIYPALGKLVSIDAKNTASTKAVTAYAAFPNPNGVLRPDQYAKVRGVATK